ncbi:MAG TPA: aromatic ring-hydroxylating dioxygenase subunit alpha, partial [Acidimicrobiales bacterium]
SFLNDASVYTDPVRFQREVEVLFRGGPVFFAMSGELPSPGSYRAATVAGLPVLVVRQHNGGLTAMVDVCRHRGATVVPVDTSGDALASLTCPYHGWVYELDGTLRARPHSAGAFDDVGLACNLPPVAVAEQHGLVFVRLDGHGPIDVDAYLSGAQDDLGSFDLGSYIPIETRTRTWRMNWKLVLDTFTESYHIRTLHRDSLFPRFNSDCVIFEPFGRNLVSIGLRKDVLDETAKPEAEWSLLPYGTIQYFLVPSGIVVHQLDHIETWRVEPIDVRTTRLTTSVFAPRPPASERERAYWVKNLDLLLQVTGSEDFPLMEAIQANLDAGALREVVYGRNEPPLIHYHRAVTAALE